jgi:16S rRNA (adenine1518-N6/adenine1519-N6)-dimethyltransferase
MTSIRKELRELGLTPRKKWGQHFLVDRNIMNKVIQTAKLETGDVVLEIGPGLGEMTLAMGRHVRKVIAVEIDRKLVDLLRKKTEKIPNIEVIHGDILKIEFTELLDREDQPVKVVANLPFQISTPLLFRFIDSRNLLSALTLMLQKEVVERITALPGRKDYGPLSIFIQSVSNVSLCFLIKPSAFFPSPKVESAVITMAWKERPFVRIEEEEWFKRMVRGCFSYRRKRLINALKHSNISLQPDMAQRLEKIGIDLQRRPETLTIQDFIHLAEVLKQ